MLFKYRNQLSFALSLCLHSALLVGFHQHILATLYSESNVEQAVFAVNLDQIIEQAPDLLSQLKSNEDSMESIDSAEQPLPDTEEIFEEEPLPEVEELLDEESPIVEAEPPKPEKPKVKPKEKPKEKPKVKPREMVKRETTPAPASRASNAHVANNDMVSSGGTKQAGQSQGRAGNASNMLGRIYGAINRHKHYSNRARSARMQGTVVVDFCCNGSGSFRHLRVAKSSGHNQLDQDALNTVRKASAHFPAEAFGKTFKVPIKFTLHGR